MGTDGSAGMATEGGDLAEQRVTPLELFFDLVFVFALTQVTGFLADHLTWTGMLQGAALLTVLWWAWGGYSWLTNAVPAEEVIGARLVILTAMAAMLVASLAVPDAFGEYGILFGLAYFVVRLLHVVLYVLATGSTPESRQAMLRLAPGFLGAPLLLIPIGVGASGLAIGTGIVIAAVLGIALAAALWWAYFDLVMLVAGQRLSAAKGGERARLARDAYSYLHLPMVAGIVLVALGIKKTLADVGDPLGTIPAIALCGGVALYLLGHNAFRLRDVGSISVPRLVVAILCCALIPVAVSVPSLVTLAVLAGLLCALAAFETMRSREFRRELRGR
jgi:low temperature requirement protein LtrA